MSFIFEACFIPPPAHNLQNPQILALTAPWQLHPARVCMRTEPSTLQGPSPVAPGGLTRPHPSAGAAPIPSSIDQMGGIRQWAVPRQARPCYPAAPAFLSMAGLWDGHGPARIGGPADVSVLGPSCGKGGELWECGCQRLDVLNFPLSCAGPRAGGALPGAGAPTVPPQA